MIPSKTLLEKSDDTNSKNLTQFCFVFFWNLVFICKGSQPRIYADLLRFLSRVKDPIHIIKFMH